MESSAAKDTFDAAVKAGGGGYLVEQSRDSIDVFKVECQATHCGRCFGCVAAFLSCSPAPVPGPTSHLTPTAGQCGEPVARPKRIGPYFVRH
jgi:hypothetical protein